MVRFSDLAGLAAGAISAVGTMAALRRTSPRATAVLSAGGLATAAAVYPLARRSRPADARAGRELAALAAYGVASAAAARRVPRQATVLLAAGWASHAAFDATHHIDEGTRLPDWYPALCAGYDLVIAAGLLDAARRA
jgi:hypothetical protein